MKFIIVTVAQLLAVDRSKLNLEHSVDQVIKNNLDAHADTKPGVQLNLSEAVAARIKELSSTASEADPAPEVTDPAPAPEVTDPAPAPEVTDPAPAPASEPTTETETTEAPADAAPQSTEASPATEAEATEATEAEAEAAPAPAPADKPKRK